MKNPVNFDHVEIIRIHKNRKTVRQLKPVMPKWIWLLVKFFLYGGMGLVLEIVFTDVVRCLHAIPGIGQIVSSFTSMSFPAGIPDQMLFPWKFMFAMSSFWMLFVYGSGIYLIEWIYRMLKPSVRHKNILLRRGVISRLLRALIYALAIMVVEFTWGWFYRLILGDFLWQYKSFLVTTTFTILPYWFAGSIVLESIVKKTSEKDLEYAFRTDFELPLPGDISETASNKSTRRRPG